MIIKTSECIIVLIYDTFLIPPKDGIELSRGRTNRLIKMLEQFDVNNTDAQLLKRGQTFKFVSPKLSSDLGTKSQSSAALYNDTPSDELQNEKAGRKDDNPEIVQLRKTFRKSMLNEYDSE